MVNEPRVHAETSYIPGTVVTQHSEGGGWGEGPGAPPIRAAPSGIIPCECQGWTPWIIYYVESPGSGVGQPVVRQSV